MSFELTRLTAFGFILEIFFMVELLFAGSENKIRRTVHTFQNPVLKFWHGTILKEGKRCACHSRTAVRSWTANRSRLFDFPATFLPVPFACQRLLDPQFFARLQIEGMPLDFFNDVFLLYLPLETPESVFQGFTVLESDFSQNLRHLQTDQKLHSGKNTSFCQGTDIIWTCSAQAP
jgi:hypothetical protein